MDRRTALKLFGTLFVCLAGQSVKAEEIGKLVFKNPSSDPVNYYFSEKGMGDITIKRKDGSEVKVPFKDIVDALKEPAIDWRPVVSMDGGRYPFIRFQSLEIGARSDGVVVWRKK